MADRRRVEPKPPGRSVVRSLITLIGVIGVTLAELALLLGVYHRSDSVQQQQLLLARSSTVWSGATSTSGSAIQALRRAGASPEDLAPLESARHRLVLTGKGTDAQADRAALVAAADDLARTLDARHRRIDGQTAITYLVLLTIASVGWFCWFRRVIRRHRALQQRLTAKEEQAAGDQKLRALVQNSADLVVILDADLTATFVSPAARQVLGYAPDDLMGEGLLGHVDEYDVPRFVQIVDDLEHDADRAVQLRMTHQDGRSRVMEGVLANLLAHPSVSGFVLTVRDMTERHDIEQELVHQAFHDGLTGLPNRELFAERLGQALSGRYDPTRPVVVLFCDLDDFKEVNDRLGHAAGDEVLTVVGQRLGALVGGGNTAARLGGDEFAVLMVDASPEDGEHMAERVSTAMAAPVEIAGVTLHLRVSVGVAHATPGTVDSEQALRNADFAMQWAKDLGKSRYEVYDATLHARSLDRLELRGDLQRGLRDAELVLHYQPTVCLESGDVMGFEALVRWQHPTRGLLMPGDFVPLAEETGLVVQLGSWVLREACQFAASLPHGSQELTMSVNVATLQLYQDSFVAEVQDVLVETGLHARRLILELTETSLLSELDLVKPRLSALRGLGVRLAIDDFGTGYSSLAYLAELTLDILKVDKSFIDRLTDDPQGRSITQAILTMSRHLHLDTVAEGVEEHDQAQWLIKERCAMAQGFFWSKPVDADAVRRMLETQPDPRHLCRARSATLPMAAEPTLARRFAEPSHA
jgi:diguanylate cyclase (GGDEF)-like protein/PAS domain S-box-containing protein